MTSGARAYYGAHLGPLSELHHAVSGDVYAVDSRTLFIKNFNYDGEGPGKASLRLFSFNFTSTVFFIGLFRVRIVRLQTTSDSIEFQMLLLSFKQHSEFVQVSIFVRR